MLDYDDVRQLKKDNCFDFNLFQEENILFFLMSSKDNIILNVKDVLVCYRRKDLENELIDLNNGYYTFSAGSVMEGMFVSQKARNYLMNRTYCVYDLRRTFDNAYFPVSYKLNDVVSIL
jgi:hypothetical protein